MQQFIGTKIINAVAMSCAVAEDVIGRSVAGERLGDGYLVEYQDGYQSWSPKDVFEQAYRATTAMTFGDALVMLKQGKQVARAGWNGKGMWLAMVPAHNYQIAPGLLDSARENPCSPRLLPWIGMKTADGGFVPWLASQTDLLADDWMIA